VTDARFVIAGAAIDERVASRVGGKALALARMARAGIDVPPFVAVTTDAYETFLDAAGLRVRILFELERKDFADMRWEEMWDAALRIRNLFLTTAMPADLRAALAEPIAEVFAETPTVVRSSAPGEDSAATSFAGLHESFVNVRGVDAVLERVKLVWASLWSDGALLYRRELGLDPTRSAMAVVVQQIVAGRTSGVAFSRHPEDHGRTLVEAVHGLNQGLVDGTVEPDRWTVDRRDRRVVEHRAAERREMMTPAPDGVRLVPLPPDRRRQPPLDERELAEVVGLAWRAEDHFAAPQDVEWTLRRRRLFALQSRPITTLAGAAGDGRASYLSLRRSFDNLVALRRRIEDEEIPAMVREADRLADATLERLTDDGLLEVLADRKAAHDRWVDAYVADFIPFAHGARLFGRAYNDAVRPDDPYEFADLLAATPMLSLRRNAALESIAALLREGDDEGADRAADVFVTEFGDAADADRGRAEALAVAHRLAARPAGAPPARPDPDELARRYLDAVPADEQEHAAALLDLGRASWRLRDDDNMYLGRLDALLRAAVAEAGRRGLTVDPSFGPRRIELPSPLGGPAPGDQTDLAPPPDADAPKNGAQGASPAGPLSVDSVSERRARQIVGQPAGPGLALGRARVIATRDDLLAFEDGEILVCDAIQPEMTFVVPLAAGIVERRGGMLIHGAIIAREYGLPCVTGVPGATELIRTGQRVTVDGYLGIVIVG
jgi:rifampicin phosphotransferase